ncbi:MAG: apolipoprotein N-acyltransferase [Candidatus Andeanibacterium colombiense]|uniref:Apolipoprotein N-acyltransferase n=1 Tax=Candidatus Andeanibacterium colombiense TaxID=3121345 RepID=A0AAJ5X4I1_9SPHN|nr:MAG: apolipoprotein N-acyltransferase [Sphingomonadaceae bacterium]
MSAALTLPTDLARRAAAHKRLTALALGLFSAFGFAPLALWPVALLAIGGFVLLLGRVEGRREAFLLGWLFGLAHFTFGNNWIATAFTYQAEMPAVLGWAAVPLLALYLALYPALAALGARLFIREGAAGWPLALAFAGTWIVSEWLRSWIFTGYAWNPFGVVLLSGFARPGIAALAPWLGTYALSGLAVLLGAGAALLLYRRQLVLLGFLAALVTAGMLWPGPEEGEGTLRYTLVQPDIRQEELNQGQFYEANFRKTAALSAPVRAGEHRLVLWPESGVPDYLLDGYPQRYYDYVTAFGNPDLARLRIGRTIGPGSLLMTGAVDLEFRNGEAAGARNAVTALDETGAIRGHYAKAHLVPYGEYLPMRYWLEPIGLSRLVPGAIDFWPGPGPRTLDLGGWGKAGVQVCYEIVFSGQVTDRKHRPDYIFNPSNDGWFGSFGPPQHLAQARLRAIEEGLPILRSTTTGISAVIDAHGVVRAHIGQHVPGRLDGIIPPALPPTLFAKLGNLLPLCWAAALLVIAAIALRLRRR